LRHSLARPSWRHQQQQPVAFGIEQRRTQRKDGIDAGVEQRLWVGFSGLGLQAKHN